MYLTTLPPDDAVGHILRHNVIDAAGHKVLSKGRRLRAADAEQLRALGLREVRVAILEPGDVHENEAASRLGIALGSAGIQVSPPVASRVNLTAAVDGVVQVDVAALLAINALDGLTVATLPSHALVRARRRLATIKIIPFAVRESALAQAEQIAQSHAPLLALRPLRALRVGVVLVASPQAHARMAQGVSPAIAGRVADLGATLCATRYVEPDEHAVAEVVVALCQAGAELLIIAGETSIMDCDDLTPRGIRLAGGRIEHYGAPVEPGNLLLLAYLPTPAGPLPVIGAPGCVRSRDVNIVDLLLPRLLAGEHVSKADIIALGHGGLIG